MEAKEVKPASSTTSDEPSKMAAAAVIPEGSKSVILNVGGQRFEVLRKNLANFPV